MLLFIKSERTALVAGKTPKKTSVNFEGIVTAKPTEGKKLLPNHAEQSVKLIQTIKAYQFSNNLSDKKLQFNLVINTCLDCHKQVCPGPIEAIEKNLLQLNGQ